MKRDATFEGDKLSIHLSPDDPNFPAPLLNRLEREVDADGLSDAVALIWQDIHSALAPIVGARGVAALFTRSIQLSSPAHPWLGGLSDGSPDTINIAQIRPTFANQRRDVALDASLTLLRNFHDLLSGLVGAALTARLLQSVWPGSESSPQKQALST